MILTCGACPSQWEGYLEDGRMFYIRFRWGWLSICVSENPTEQVHEAMENEIYGQQISHNLDGVIDEIRVLYIMTENGFTMNDQLIIN